MTTNELPKGIRATDLKWARNTVGSFEIWNVKNFGWCIPTLAIKRAGRSSLNDTRRTYAVRISDSNVCRIGHGPHVLATHTVYIKATRVQALACFLNLQRKGLEDAGSVRDRISSRRAQGQLERAQGKSFWRWKV